MNTSTRIQPSGYIEDDQDDATVVCEEEFDKDISPKQENKRARFETTGKQLFNYLMILFTQYKSLTI
jgi:hypothetical protein